MRNEVSSRRPIRFSNALAVALLCAALVGGCASGIPRGYVDATAWSANYTEDYIRSFFIETASGKDTGLEGIQVKEFSEGGTGSSECCSLIPGVGQTIRVVWTIANTDDKTQWITYSREVIVIGTMPKTTAPHSVLTVRFFPDHEVEAELLPGDGNFGPANPRTDKLFFVGPRVMRHIGE